MTDLPDIPNTQRDDGHHAVNSEWATNLSTSVVSPQKNPVSEGVGIFIEDTEHSDEWILSDTFVVYDGTTEISLSTERP